MRFLAVIVVMLTVTACVDPQPTATPVPTPTDAPTPTSTTMPTVTSAPTPTPTPVPWGRVWRYLWKDIGRQAGYPTGVVAKASHVGGSLWSAELGLLCDNQLRVPSARVSLSWQGGVQVSGYMVDDIFISRRSAGGTGPWMKSIWNHEWTGTPRAGVTLMLEQEPADGFIRELMQVEELGVLVTYKNSSHRLGAVFPVEHLGAALEAEEVDWRC